jgi:hypothetical protein
VRQWCFSSELTFCGDAATALKAAIDRYVGGAQYIVLVSNLTLITGTRFAIERKLLQEDKERLQPFLTARLR